MEVRRSRVTLGLLALVGVCLAALGGLGSRQEPGPGDPTPATWRGQDRASPVLAWVFRGEDCLSCFTPAYELRRLQSDYGDRLTLWAVAVEDRESLAAGFLRRERIETIRRSLDMDSYRRAFGRARLPALYLSFRDTIRGVWKPGPNRPWGAAGARPALHEVVADLMPPRTKRRD